MEIIPKTSIDVKLECTCYTYEAISDLSTLKGSVLNIIPRNDEERILFELCEAGYYWDDKYIYDDNVKVCKLNHVSQQIIFNPEHNPDLTIIKICEGYECYWKGEIYDHNRIS